MFEREHGPMTDWEFIAKRNPTRFNRTHTHTQWGIAFCTVAAACDSVVDNMHSQISIHFAFHLAYA